MKFFALYFIMAISLYSCNNKQEKPDQHIKNPELLNRQLAKTNQILAISEDEQINDLKKRRGWNLNKTGTGLNYKIFNNTNKTKVENLSIVRINKKVELINGFVCYDSAKDGYYELQIGKSNAPNGLEEGLLMMREGEKAILILPSHLAFGLLGDNEKIPTRAILIYHIEILQVRN